jgi:uncharacterized protein YerC
MAKTFLGFTHHGQNNPRASKLTADQVREIKKMIADKVHDKEIAEKFNCSEANISRIRRGITWNHIK